MDQEFLRKLQRRPIDIQEERLTRLLLEEISRNSAKQQEEVLDQQRVEKRIRELAVIQQIWESIIGPKVGALALAVGVKSTEEYIDLYEGKVVHTINYNPRVGRALAQTSGHFTPTDLSGGGGFTEYSAGDKKNLTDKITLEFICVEKLAGIPAYKFDFESTNSYWSEVVDKSRMPTIWLSKKESYKPWGEVFEEHRYIPPAICKDCIYPDILNPEHLPNFVQQIESGLTKLNDFYLTTSGAI